MHAHDSGLPMLEEAALGFLIDNVLAFQVGMSVPPFFVVWFGVCLSAVFFSCFVFCAPSPDLRL